jgi:hypothetical protein
MTTKYTIRFSQCLDEGEKSNRLTLMLGKHIFARLLHTIYGVDDKYILYIHIFISREYNTYTKLYKNVVFMICVEDVQGDWTWGFERL